MSIDADLGRLSKLVGAIIVIAAVAILWGGLPGDVGDLKKIVALQQIQIEQQETFRRTYLCIEMGFTGENIMTCPLMLEDMGEAPVVGRAARLSVGE